MDQNDEMKAAMQSVEEALPLRKIRELVERMDASADAKALIMDIAGVSVKIGEKLVAIGRKVVSFVFDLVQRFPNSIFGIIMAFTVSALIGSVPFIGAALAPILAPLLLAFGLTSGALADFKEAGVTARIQGLEQQFSALAAKG